MNEDLLERQLSEAMGRRAGAAAPPGPDFADVAGRARRHRRRTSVVRAAAAASIALVLIAVLTVSGTRSGRDDAVTAGPADGPSTTSATVPTGVVGDRWGVFSEIEPVRTDPPLETVVGVQPTDASIQGIEVTPYLVVGTPTPEAAVIYGLDGDRWMTTTSWYELEPIAGGQIHLLRGSGFDPSRFTEVPNSTGSYMVEDPTQVVAVPLPFENARPEELLAAPSSRPLELSVEHLGDFDWAIVPQACPAVGERCQFVAVGGDADRLLVVDVSIPRTSDGRDLLASVGLRSADELTEAPGTHPPAAGVEPAVVAWWGAPRFLTVRLPIALDDSVWPAEVPADYCTAYRQWKQIQIDDLGAYGIPGWIRWARALDAVAPPEVGDAYSVLAAEQSAGHDTSATEPGIGALDTVVTDGDARCPG